MKNLGCSAGRDRRGQMAVAMVIGMVAVIFLIMVGIDMTATFHAKQTAQNIADAAALKGLEQLATAVTPAEFAAVEQNVQAHADWALARTKLNAEPARATVTPSADGTTKRISVTATIDRKSSVMQWIDPSAAAQPVSATGTAQIGPGKLAVMLVLDISLSMSQLTMSQLMGPVTKIVAMEEAVKKFVEGLPDDATVGLITYYSTEDTDETSVRVAFDDPDQKNAVTSAISRLSASGGTPMQTALALARKEFVDHPPDAQTRRITILFTDGVPTVIRGCFTAPKVPGQIHPATGWSDLSCGASQYDYTFQNYMHQGPAFYSRDFPGSLLDADDRLFEVSRSNDIAKALASFDWVDFAGHPRSLGSANPKFLYYKNAADNYSDASPVWENIVSPSFLMTIIEADNLRAENVTIYTVGFGKPASTIYTDSETRDKVDKKDPYQGATRVTYLGSTPDQRKAAYDADKSWNGIISSYVHSYLLKRIANDPAAATDPSFNINPTAEGDPESNYDPTPGVPAGKFVEAADQDELMDAFDKILGELMGQRGLVPNAAVPPEP